MKQTKLFKTAFAVAALGASLSSCSTDDSGDVTPVVDLAADAKAANNVVEDATAKGASAAIGEGWAAKWSVPLSAGATAIDATKEVVELKGDITASTTLTADKVYKLTAGVHVKSPAVLTIEAGTVVFANASDATAYLLIERGAKIMAEGTADAPIVFTSGAATPKRGDWGGLIVCGSAPINREGGEATAEVGDVKYGGTVADDNSGVMKYIRLEYTGNSINEEKEHNGFTFNGVGSGTVAQYLQSHYGGDDGFEWFGGTLNASYLIATGAKDDSFDFTYGWVGTGMEWIAEQASDEGDRGVEGDNSSKDRSAAPYSNPTISKVTLKGNGVSDGMKLREGTKGNFSDIKIDNFEDGVEVEHDETLKNVIDGSLKVKAAVENTSANTIKFKASISA